MISSDARGQSFVSQTDMVGELIPSSVAELMGKIHNIPYNRDSIPQENLNLANKSRTSLFPWRGQFSPELIELFLDRYSQAHSIILDPFVGSGTTLFEATRKGLECYGAEINPSAIEMARTVYFAALHPIKRKGLFQKALAIAEKYTQDHSWDLFSCINQDRNLPCKPDSSIETDFNRMLQEVENEPLIYNLLINAIIRYMTYRSPRSNLGFIQALQEHIKVVADIPYSGKACKVFHTDARTLPLSSSTIDLIITSPPYINVFNYHQNNRPAMELVGWDLLKIAKSEIGSNRKNRQNRFLTVVQYALDMLDTLQEMRRLLRSNGRAIIIVGRESNVKGLRFRNGMLVAALAAGGAKFQLEMLQERAYTNKFGEMIYEDILHLIPTSNTITMTESDFARSVAVWSLVEAYIGATDKQLDEVLDAIERASTVQKSPLFSIAIADSGSFLPPEKKNA